MKTSREIALERRKAMSDSGKKAVANSSTTVDRVRTSDDMQISGIKSSIDANITNTAKKHIPTAKMNKKSFSKNLSSKELVIERRKAMSTHGKSAINSSDRTRTEANKKIQVNEIKITSDKSPDLSNSGNSENKVLNTKIKRRVTQKRKPITNTSRDIVLARREAQSKHGKSASKQNSSAASLARRGDPDLSSREISQRVRELRSKTGATSKKGNGKCRPCGPNKNGSKMNIADASWKVGKSETNSGQTVTGTQANRSLKTTGNEASTCRSVTGTQYLGSEVLNQFCQNQPEYKQPTRSSVTSTSAGNKVTGNEVGRSEKVTGDEPGTCKNVTGTPYAGLDQVEENCNSDLITELKDKGKIYLGGSSNARLTGIQPGIGGSMTGAGKGACLNPTGTPYVGGDQLGNNCSNHSSEKNYANSERKNSSSWEEFSVNSPSRDKYSDKKRDGVTGNEYENGSKITGPFDMAEDTVTGTEQFRFDKNKNSLLTPKKDLKEFDSSKERAQSRITGEGQSAGLKITGDDWARGNRVTGTEGASARKRNPTRPGMTSAMPVMDIKRNDEMKEPDFLITGSSGNTREGQLVTFSGGARG